MHDQEWKHEVPKFAPQETKTKTTTKAVSTKNTFGKQINNITVTREQAQLM